MFLLRFRDVVVICCVAIFLSPLPLVRLLFLYLLGFLRSFNDIDPDYSDLEFALLRLIFYWRLVLIWNDRLCSYFCDLENFIIIFSNQIYCTPMSYDLVIILILIWIIWILWIKRNFFDDDDWAESVHFVN